MNELEIRKDVVNTAAFFLKRYNEVGNHNFVIDLYNKISPIPRGYHMGYTDAWCAAFVSAVGYKCGIEQVILPECSCLKMIQLYKNRNLWIEDDSIIPDIADLIFYNWEDSGNGDNTGSPNHVGIVSAVKEGIITVIEGNKGNAVGIRTLSVNGLYIRGYAKPDYASISTPAEPKVSGWGKEAYNWALDMGITDGTNPSEPISLERFLTILYRYDEKRRSNDGNY